jgi:hypothetical protein
MLRMGKFQSDSSGSPSSPPAILWISAARAVSAAPCAGLDPSCGAWLLLHARGGMHRNALAYAARDRWPRRGGAAAAAARGARARAVRQADP